MSVFKFVFRISLGALFSMILSMAGGALAQEHGRTILVLDASGSMWGQIEGKAKITIAQEVIGELLASIPPDQDLGLTVYGHRHKGDCSDIETLVAPAPNTRAAIQAAVNAIKPKGKTPLSAAVIAAAEKLRYTEEKATVILVSDGKETCHLDPCEVGKQLEDTGVDFTAHVIGFDVARQADRAQLQCLAENTGGTFRTATNAAELTQALKAVAEPTPPAPALMRFIAKEGPDGNRLTANLVWSITNSDTGEAIVDMVNDDRLRLTMPPGNYRVEVLLTTTEAYAQADISVAENTDATVTMVLPLMLPTATLDAPTTAVVGQNIAVTWKGPGEENDYLSTATPDQRDSATITYAYTRDGAPLLLQMPPVPGTYEIRYVLGARSKVIARKTIDVLPADVSLEIKDQLIAGETADVTWIGPNYDLDYISVADIGARDGQAINYSYTRDGNPLGVRMPTTPGTYELRYVLHQGDTVIARKNITITPVTATLDAPSNASAGEEIAITWTGPNYDLDYVSVAGVGTRGSQALTYSYTRDGSPLGVRMPDSPGEYEIRYVLHQGNTILATRRITVQ